MFASATLIQLLFFVFIFRKLSFAKEVEDKVYGSDIRFTEPVSIIICAKNEAANLRENLPYILKQNYKTFEVVLINDASSDETLEVMEEFASRHRNIKIVDVASNETFWGNKKYALTLGIKVATSDYLLFTDADCKPNSENWVAQMANCFTSQKSIVLGYSPYKQVKNSFLNILIRFETLLTGLQYLSYARAGIPYMGVGRNLAYHKKEFFNAKGFVNHIKLLSGDDDLFVNQVANKANSVVCIAPGSFITSNPKRSFSEWFRQKRRHVSTASYYKLIHRILLGFYFITKILFWISLFILLFQSYKLVVTISIAVFLLIVKLIFYRKAFSRLGDTSLWWSTPLLEIFLITFQFAIFIANRISKPKHWK